MTETLNKIYYDQKNSGSFSGVSNLYRSAKEKDPSITLKQVKEFLSEQFTYTLHYPRRDKFKRNRIIVNNINEQFEADLVDMATYARNNSGYNYILAVIDCFSKKAFVRPVKTKKAEEIRKAFESIFEEAKPLRLRTDRGLEFLNTVLKTYLKKINVDHFTSNDDHIKCAIVERFNRTLKSRMFKYFTAKGTRKYMDVLQDFVKAYNNSYHRSIKMKPVEVNYDNEDQVFENLYGCKKYTELKQAKIPRTKIKTGDQVRIPYKKEKMDKGYYPNFSEHIYTVEKSIKGDRKYVFKIKDYSGKVLKQIFYPEQLLKIKDNLYRVEKILKRRTRRGVKEVFVKWLNFPPSYNSWIPAKDVKELRN